MKYKSSLQETIPVFVIAGMADSEQVRPFPYQLMRHLMDNYNPSVIPYGWNSTLVTVTVDISINQLIDVVSYTPSSEHGR